MTWCGTCYTNTRGRTNVTGHIGFRPLPSKYIPFEEWLVKRPEIQSAKGTGKHPANGEDAFVKKHPTIITYMTDDVYEDGGARELSALSISIREGDVLIALNDKDLKQSMYTQAHTLQDALKLMEGALSEGNAQWRPWKAGKRK